MKNNINLARAEDGVSGYAVCGAYSLNENRDNTVLHAVKIWKITIPEEELPSAYNTYLEQTLDTDWGMFYFLSGMLFVLALISWWGSQGEINPGAFRFGLVLFPLGILFFLFKAITGHLKYLYHTKGRTPDLHTKENISKCLSGKSKQILKCLLDPDKKECADDLKLPEISEETNSMSYMIVAAAESESELSEASVPGWRPLINSMVSQQQ